MAPTNVLITRSYLLDFLTFAQTKNQYVWLSTASELQLWLLVEAACWHPRHARKGLKKEQSTSAMTASINDATVALCHGNDTVQ